jgi:hypothetical protein
VAKEFDSTMVELDFVLVCLDLTMVELFSSCGVDSTISCTGKSFLT